MTALERRLHDAFGQAGEPPSPDLFARVVGSIADDRARRRRRRRWLAVAALASAAVITAVLAFSPREIGVLIMPWWVLELATNAVLVGLAFWLGPFIKRFGRAHAADVFHDNPMTGKSYIVLTDIVYYLIFAAYILFTISFAPAADWRLDVSAAQVEHECVRLGGILLIIGGAARGQSGVDAGARQDLLAQPQVRAQATGSRPGRRVSTPADADHRPRGHARIEKSYPGGRSSVSASSRPTSSAR